MDGKKLSRLNKKGKGNGFQHSFAFPVLLSDFAFAGPFPEQPTLAGFLVHIISFCGKRRFNLEIEKGLVAKAEADAVVFGSGDKLQGFQGLAFDLGKVSNVVLPFNPEGFGFPAGYRAMGELRPVGRAFTVAFSHLALLYGAMWSGRCQC